MDIKQIRKENIHKIIIHKKKCAVILKNHFDFPDDTYMVCIEKKVHLDIEKQLHLLFEQNAMTKEKALVNIIERKQWSHQKNKINT